MHIESIKTAKITPDNADLYGVLDEHLSTVEEGTVLAITSKIVSICQGRIVPLNGERKAELVQREADYFLPSSVSKYKVWLTIKDNILTPSAGIDESNGAGYAILWPEEPQTVANAVRAYLQRRFSLTHVGVLLTDSAPAPLRWGVTGCAIAHSGFLALRDYRGTPDLFGRPLAMTTANVREALAAAAVLVMGEGNQSTPLALLRDLPFVTFQERDPLPEELDALRIDMADDLYAPLLESVDWQRGGGRG